MNLTSLYFFIFFGLSLMVYYICPRRWRWVVLLAFSLFFVIRSSVPATLLYFVAVVITDVICSNQTAKCLKAGKTNAAARITGGGVILNFTILAILKYNGFLIGNLNRFLIPSGHQIPSLNLAAPIGISFYTFTSVGLLLDVYWGVAEACRNPLKMATFLGFYPQLTSGPIARYSETWLEIFGNHRFSYSEFCLGVQRMLWGVFKKLVLSARFKMLVDPIYAAPDTYSGFYLWIAAAAFNLQLYTDFSGCMDIVLGAARCYGVRLPENFEAPFFSRTVQEFWQKWHITLGTWMKNYVMYPLLKSNGMQKLNQSLRKRAGKKTANHLTSYLGSLVVWLLIGLWHGGGWKYILGMGLWFWGIITLEKIAEPGLRKLTEVLHGDRENAGYHLLQSIKVFVFVSIGNVFFRMDGLRPALHVFRLSWWNLNASILEDGSLLKISGLSMHDVYIMAFGLAALFFADYLRVAAGSARSWIQRQFIAFRWLIWLGLLAFVLIAGKYGPGFDAQTFIYGQF